MDTGEAEMTITVYSDSCAAVLGEGGSVVKESSQLTVCCKKNILYVLSFFVAIFSVTSEASVANNIFYILCVFVVNLLLFRSTVNRKL